MIAISHWQNGQVGIRFKMITFSKKKSSSTPTSLYYTKHICVQIAAKKGRPSTCHLITGRSQVPASAGVPSLTTQVTDQWKFAGQLPEWSDSGTPALAGTGDTPVIN